MGGFEASMATQRRRGAVASSLPEPYDHPLRTEVDPDFRAR